MSFLRIERVNALPGTLAASTIYIVKAPEPENVDLYFTNLDGSEIRRIVNKSDMVSMLGTMEDLQNSNYLSTATNVIDALLLLDGKVNQQNTTMRRFVFDIPSLVWDVNHQLDTDSIIPSIRDQDNNLIQAPINFIDNNNLSVSFTEAQAGHIVLTYG